MLLENILDVEVDLITLKDARPDEISKVIKSHSIIQQARDDFLAGLLTWSDYLDLCEMHKMNIDSYLETVGKNLEAVGVIV